MPRIVDAAAWNAGMNLNSLGPIHMLQLADTIMIIVYMLFYNLPIYHLKVDHCLTILHDNIMMLLFASEGY